MNIRKFVESDFSSVIRIYAESKLDELVHEDTQFELVSLDKDVIRLEKLRESDIYVYDDGGVVGYGAIYKSEIRSLFISPTRRREGIGKALLEYLLFRAKSPVTLYVAKSNTKAKDLYAKYGFNVLEEFTTTYNDKSVLANRMVMVKHS